MDKQTIATYNALARAYDEETKVFWDIFPRTYIDTFARLVHGEVLDVGSGPGRDGLLLQEKGLEVVCIDASETMVQLSRERGLRSVVGDFSSLPFPKESFDGVWAYTSLLHVPKSEVHTTLSEIVRILKHNGLFALGLIEGEGEYYRENMGAGHPRWFSYYSKEEVEALLAEHQFTVEYFEQFTQPSRKNYLHFISRKKSIDVPLHDHSQ